MTNEDSGFSSDAKVALATAGARGIGAASAEALAAARFVTGAEYVVDGGFTAR